MKSNSHLMPRLHCPTNNIKIWWAPPSMLQDFSSEALSIVGMANDALELVKALKLSTKPNVLSISMGSCVALAAAVLHGSSFASFVMIAASAGSPSSPAATAWAQSVLLDPEARPMDQLAINYPLEYSRAAKAACDGYFHSAPLGPGPYNFTTGSRHSYALVEYVRPGMDDSKKVGVYCMDRLEVSILGDLIHCQGLGG
ncbi:hypothetical protein F751_5352 [Auxenochlorella protothecoides]|uniref:Uncharacterized protein n=1 Tax=Auxenochlorella protothecoides TaxID=3075 RepID=A0A087SRT5_AUXPR|nr:hypothetical protein F751_5352 [Auxenochlorella protothecoides]KFM28439.1 hypothetical protein F751_5352 [Auxenochlorella protothecoides]